SYIESSINSVMDYGRVSIGTSSLMFGGTDKLLLISAKDVVVFGDNNNIQAKIPEIDFQYNVISVLSGSFIPSALNLVGLELRTSEFFGSNPSNNSFNLGNFDTSKIDEITIERGRLILPSDNKVWDITSAKAEFEGKKTDIDVNLSPSENEFINISGDTLFEDGSYSVVFTVKNFNTDNLKLFRPDMLDQLSLSINGSIGVIGNVNNKEPDYINFEIPSMSGKVSNQELLRDTLLINKAAVNGSYNKSSKSAELKIADLKFNDGTKVSLDIKSTDLQNYKINAFVDSLSPKNLYKYWPKGVADNAINWVNQSISGGVLKEAKAQINIDKNNIDAATIDLRFKFMGLNVDYFKGLKPVSDVYGIGIMNVNSIKFILDSAIIGDSNITGTDIVLDDFQGKVQNFYLTGNVAGAAADIADFYVKLGKGKKVIQDSQNIAGNASSKLSLSFPLLADLPMDNVNISLSSTIKSGKVEGAYGGINLSDLAMDLRLKNDEYAIKGSAISQITKASENVVFGNTPVVFEIANGSGQLAISTAMDLSSSEISIPQMEVKKLAGDGAKLLLKLIQVRQGNPIIKSLEFKSDPLNFSATGELLQSYEEVSNLQFSNLEFGKTAVAGKLSTKPYISAEFKGDVIDIAPIIKYLSESEEEGNEVFMAKLSASKVLMAKDEFYRDAYIGVSCNAEVCGNFQLTTKGTKIDINPATLTIESDDAGKFMRAFDIYQNMKGGKLSVTGDVSGNNYDGEIKVTDFSILNAKTLAKMLTLGSLTGIADTLAGNGISFKKLQSKFKMSKEKLDVEDYRMVGNSIGITSLGSIDRKTDEVALAGNIIPAYTANTLLGKI
ncbi:MAG: AsmA-like C-terminal domain-containing protein, partial [Rickettsiales bacterium]